MNEMLESFQEEIWRVFDSDGQDVINNLNDENNRCDLFHRIKYAISEWCEDNDIMQGRCTISNIEQIEVKVSDYL
jgi:hypothetical protein